MKDDAGRITPAREPADCYTVTEIAEAIRQHLESEFPDCAIIGETANCKIHTSGHIYLSLRDGESQLAVVIFRRHAAALAAPPANGELVIASGRLTHYGRQGQTQLVAYDLVPAGRGALEIEFRRLLKRLTDEGLTAPERKRSLPRFPERIAVITSLTGAVIEDITKTLAQRWPLAEIVHIPSDVQGGAAARSIVRAFDRANRMADLDLVILARGGGSIEDLAPFNDENVARAIQSSVHPVVSGIGHETDTTIADYVADVRAATPTAAAAAAAPDAEAVRCAIGEGLARLDVRVAGAVRDRVHALRYALRSGAFLGTLHRLERAELGIDELRTRLVLSWDETRGSGMQRIEDSASRCDAALERRLHATAMAIAEALTLVGALAPAERLRAARGAVARIERELRSSIRGAAARRLRELEARLRSLEDLSPSNVLRRGFALCTVPGKERIISRAGEVEAGDEMLVNFYDAGALCRVDRTGMVTPWRRKRPSRKQ